MFGAHDSTVDVEHGKEEEHQGLHALGNQEQAVNRDGAQDRCHNEEQNEHDFFAADVTEKTERKRERAGEVGHDFQREHQRDEPLGNSEELLDVLVMPDKNADHIVQNEDEVVFGLAVGALKPGMRPMKFENRMKTKRPHRNGTNLEPTFSPMDPHTNLSIVSTIASQKFCSPPGTMVSLRLHRKARVKRMAMTIHV